MLTMATVKQAYQLSTGKSTLDYHGLKPDRLALMDPSAGVATGDHYFDVPGMVAFVDYQKASQFGLYIHYMAVRRDHQGQGLASEIVEHLIQSFPGLKELDFGKLMEPEMQSVVDKVKAKHPGIYVNYKVYYR
jgi:GNAT superfamily N-acetyltransferase